MHVYICIYIYIFVCVSMHRRIDVYMYIYIHVWSTCLFGWRHCYTVLRTHRLLYTFTSAMNILHVCIYIHRHIYRHNIYIHIYVYTFTLGMNILHVCICIYRHTYRHILCVCVSVYVCVCARRKKQLRKYACDRVCI